MSKEAALAIIDENLNGSHAKLNRKPGVRIARVLAQLRAEIEEIVEQE